MLKLGHGARSSRGGTALEPGKENRRGGELGGHPGQPQRERRHDRLIRPRAGARADISTPSRTPSPPGSTATTNPATVAERHAGDHHRRKAKCKQLDRRPQDRTNGPPRAGSGRARSSRPRTRAAPAQEPAVSRGNASRPDPGDRQRDQARQPAENRRHTTIRNARASPSPEAQPVGRSGARPAPAPAG